MTKPKTKRGKGAPREAEEMAAKPKASGTPSVEEVAPPGQLETPRKEAPPPASKLPTVAEAVARTGDSSKVLSVDKPEPEREESEASVALDEEDDEEEGEARRLSAAKKRKSTLSRSRSGAAKKRVKKEAGKKPAEAKAAKRDSDAAVVATPAEVDATTWYPGVAPPELGTIWFNRLYPCFCGQWVSPNHVNQCKAAMQHWAFTRAAWLDYEKARRRVVGRQVGEVKVVEEDFPKFVPPQNLRVEHYDQYAELFPAALPANKGQALKEAGEIIRCEETRYWAGSLTHRAAVEWVVKKFGEWPRDWMIRGADADVPRRLGTSTQLPPASVPRDLYVARAIRAAHVRAGKEFDALATDVFVAGGSDRGMVVPFRAEGTEEEVGRASQTLLLLAALEDHRAMEAHKEAGEGVKEPVLWFGKRAREDRGVAKVIEELVADALDADKRAQALLDRVVGASIPSPVQAAPAATPAKKKWELSSSDEDEQPKEVSREEKKERARRSSRH